VLDRVNGVSTSLKDRHLNHQAKTRNQTPIF
jgi:hypothetical protein